MWRFSMKGFSMKTILFLLAGALAGCQSWQARAPDQTNAPPYGGAGAGAGSSGTTGSTSSGTGGQPGMDQYAMCEMNRRIMGARTPEERQALMDRNMPGVSPELREQHLQMMREQCK
jgi:hypothetical protein